MRLRTVLTIALGAMALTACNQLVSKEPWFQPDPAAPALRDGVWSSVKADCAFDESMPAKDWPDCTDWLVLKDGRPVDGQLAGGESTPDSPLDGSIVLSPGDPMIWQLEMLSKSENAKPERHFEYYGVEADAHDQEGRITKLTVWPILCGPPGENGRVTKHPWPGLTIVDGSCTAASAAIVRESARRSLKLTLEKDLPKLRWVRDGSR